MKAELGEKFEPWELHDLRRTARTAYSALGVPENIGELLIGHAKVDAYNKFAFENGEARRTPECGTTTCGTSMKQQSGADARSAA